MDSRLENEVRLRLIHEWKSAWRYWSVKINAIGLAIMGYLWFDPSAVLAIVNMMPSGVRRALPENTETIIGALFFALAMISRLVVQPKMEARRGKPEA